MGEKKQCVPSGLSPYIHREAVDEKATAMRSPWLGEVKAEVLEPT